VLLDETEAVPLCSAILHSGEIDRALPPDRMPARTLEGAIVRRANYCVIVVSADANGASPRTASAHEQ
jgi:hypothetical protein